jgi:hypothetical protein
METIKLGGYSAFTSYKEAEKKVQSYFSEATKHVLGVGFIPLAVAHQLVNGINYAYFTKAKGVYPEAKDYNALVIIHVSLTEVITVTEIKSVQLIKGSGQDLFGGYTAFYGLSDDSPIPAILREKTGLGVGYTALAVASQVVNGVNYAIFAKAQVVYPDAIPYNAIVTLYKTTEGAYSLTAIERVQIL